MGIYWKNIDPQLQILGPLQQANFSSIQNLTQFQINNTFVPTSLIPSENLLELRNSGLNGFRLRHETNLGDTHGTLKIQTFLNNSPDSIDFLTFNQDGTITFNSPINISPLIEVEGATQTFQYTGNQDAQFILSNTLAATSGSPSYVDLVLQNSTEGGFLLRHTSSSTDTSGLGTLQLLSLSSGGAVGQSFFTATNGTIPIFAINGSLTVAQTSIFNGASTFNSPVTINAAPLLPPLDTILYLSTNVYEAEVSFNNANSSSISTEFNIYDNGNLEFGLGFNNSTNEAYVWGYSTNALKFATDDAIRMYIMTGGTIGINTITPTQAQLVVNGGIQNVTNEESVIRAISATNSAKIELQNTATNGHLYELRSNNDGSFGLVDRTSSATRLQVTSTGLINIVTGLSDFEINLNNTNVGENATGFSISDNGILSAELGFNNSTNELYVWSYTAGGAIKFGTNGTKVIQILNSGTLDLINHKIINVANPTNPQDAATKAYVDSSMSGGAPNSATYIIQTSNASLTNAQVLGSLATGLLKNTTTTGVLSIAAAGTDYYAPGSPTKLIDNASSQNISMGRNALNNITTGGGNAIFGNSAIFLTTGGSNCIFGSNMAQALTSGGSNIIMGAGAGFTLSSGNSNTLIGASAGSSLTTPNFNVCIGVTSGGNLQTGGSNVCVGPNAGYWNGGGFASYNNCVFIGSQTQPGSATLTNAVAIGANAAVLTSNSMVLGSGLNVGIGELSPTYAKLCLVGGVQNVTNEETIIRITSSTASAKIELRNIGVGGRLYELRSDSSDSSFNIVDRTSVINRLKIDANGILNTYNNIVINNGVAGSPDYLQVGNSTDYLQIGYDITNDYSFINLASSSNDRLAFKANGTGIAALLASGLFGLGTITPTQAKLVVNGGVQNIVGEESAIRAISSLSNVKIELQNITPTTGKLYELRSSSTGTFDITDRTSSATRFSISTLGNVGIGLGLSLANSLLQFPNTSTQRLITLYEGTNNTYQYTGFGTNAGSLYTYLYSTSASHVWYAATSSTASNEIARMNGNGTAQFTKIAGYAATKPNVQSAGSLGNGATFTLSGSELSGTLIVNSGAGNASGPLLAFTLVNAMPNANWGVIFFPANGNAANVSNSIFAIAANTFQFTLNARTALANNTTYIWNYMIIGA